MPTQIKLTRWEIVYRFEVHENDGLCVHFGLTPRRVDPDTLPASLREQIETYLIRREEIRAEIIGSMSVVDEKIEQEHWDRNA